jgi:hypothetical protein
MSASIGRFAPMTAELLARKGEARPFNIHSPVNGMVVRRDVVRETHDAIPALSRLQDAAGTKGISARQEDAFGQDRIPTSMARLGELFQGHRFFMRKPQAGRRHSISLLLTDNEFERLGLVSVKKRVNRQQLLRLAIDHYFEKLADEYRSGCRCIATAAPCAGNACA